MKQGYQLIILGLLATLVATPFARAQDVHPETTPGEREDDEQQEAEDQLAHQTTPLTPAEEEEEDKGPKRIWRNSTIFFDQGVSGWTLTHEGQTYDPTTSTLIRFQPRVYLSDEWFIRLRQDFSLEETQSDTTNRNLQPMFGDGLLDLMHPDLFKVGDLTVSLGGRLTIPWSIQSQANRTILGVGAVADATYTFKHVLEGLSISFDAFANYYFSDTNAVHTESNYPCSRAAPAGQDPSGLGGTCDMAYGSTFSMMPGMSVSTTTGSNSTTQFSILFGPILSLGIVKHLNLSVIVFSWANLGRDWGTASVPSPSSPGGLYSVPDTGTHWRNEEVFYLSLTYSFTKYFDLSLNYYAFTSFLDPQGNWRDPLWGPDQQISVTAFFTLDQLYNAITGETHDPARDQRAHAAARAAGGMF